jgi:high-affinity nickel permease
MKKALINTLAALVALAGLAASCIAPWWAVWFICLPVIYAAAVTLIKTNTNYIEKY